jgi:drug/metabolite transporter (DMT)-like permease
VDGSAERVSVNRDGLDVLDRDRGAARSGCVEHLPRRIPHRETLIVGVDRQHIAPRSGVVWVVLERPNGTTEHDPRRIVLGVVLAVLGAVVAALALVLSKMGLGDYDAAAATFIRVLGGIAGMVPLVTLSRRWPSVLDSIRHPRAVPMIVLGTIFGPFAGVILYMIAVRHCPAGVVSTIISTMPVLILPGVILLYGEKVSLRAAGGAVISVVGVALLML